MKLYPYSQPSSIVIKSEADIEDSMGRELYFDLVNRCYSPSEKDILDPLSNPGDERVVREVENRFTTLPPEVAEFDHYTRAAFLVEHGERSSCTTKRRVLRLWQVGYYTLNAFRVSCR